MTNAPSWPNGWEWTKVNTGHYLAQGYEIRRLRYHVWVVHRIGADNRLATRPTLGECIALISGLG